LRLHIENIGKRALERSGKYRVNKNDEESFRGCPGQAPGMTLLILSSETRTHAWLVTALPRAACAAASRAIGTR
jgi:hypothetical protein